MHSYLNKAKAYTFAKKHAVAQQNVDQLGQKANETLYNKQTVVFN